MKLSQHHLSENQEPFLGIFLPIVLQSHKQKQPEPSQDSPSSIGNRANTNDYKSPINSSKKESSNDGPIAVFAINFPRLDSFSGPHPHPLAIQAISGSSQKSFPHGLFPPRSPSYSYGASSGRFWLLNPRD